MRLRAWLVLAPLLTTLPASAKDLLAYDWIEVRTPHFVIASAQGPEKTRELAIELEDFRRMAEIVTSIGRFEERIPTKIFLLPKSDEDLGFGGNVGGYFSSGMRANYAVLIPLGGYTNEALKHEYVHFLVHNRDGQLYPLWFDEGYADLLATLRVDGLAFEYGKPMDARVNWLVQEYSPWLNAKTLLEARGLDGFGRDRTAMFYSQSWLLVHYLVIGNGNFASRNADFLKRRERDESVTAAFEAAFGTEVNLLNKKLERYLRKARYFKGTLRQPLPPVDSRTRALPKQEIAAALGGLALRARDADAARPFFEAALAAAPDYGPALSGFGDIHKLAGRFAEAQSHYERAIARDPGNENHEIDFAEFFLHRAREAKDDGESAERVAELLVEARRHFMQAYKRNPDNPETLAMNGATYLVDGVDAALGVESLEVAHQLLPSQTDIRLLLAKAYIAAGQREKARQQLDVLLAWAHAGEVEEIRELSASLDDAKPNETASTSEGNPPAD